MIRAVTAPLVVLLVAFVLLPSMPQALEAAQEQVSVSGVSAEILDHGIYGGVLDRGPLQDGSDPMGQLKKPRLVQETEKVPARPETLFGIRYKIAAPEGVESVLLEIRVEHPPVKSTKSTDAAKADPLTSYTVERLVTPGKPYVQLQRVPPNAPEDAPAGVWRFVLLFKGKELAAQSLELVRKDSGFALLQGAPQQTCRLVVLKASPDDLGSEVASARLLEEHSFALRLPDREKACFLTLGNDQGAALGISDMSGRLLTPIQAWEPGLRVLAVSFTEIGGDAYPEIIVVAENASKNPPELDSRVYFHPSVDERVQGAAWKRMPEVDSQVAHLGSAFAVKQWLAANAPVAQ